MFSMSATGYAKLSGDERQRIDQELHQFIDRYGLDESHVHLFLRGEGPRRKGRQRHEARLHLISRMGDYYAHQEDWGADQAVRKSIAGIEHQILRQREQH